jgi:S1-C subfamily serine protease
MPIRLFLKKFLRTDILSFLNKIIVLFQTFVLAGSGAAAFAEDISDIRNSVIRVSVVSQVPDYSLPWNPGKLIAGRGAGFVISDNRILTNAHIVSDARLIMVQKENDSRRYEAKVKFIAHDCDLAMLEVLDASFFKGLKPLFLDCHPLIQPC